MGKELRPRSIFNTINPVVIFLGYGLNLWTVLVFYVFPYTDALREVTFTVDLDNDAFHYSFFAVYLVFWLMALWSFIAAVFSDPGRIPREARNYDQARLS